MSLQGSNVDTLRAFKRSVTVSKGYYVRNFLIMSGMYSFAFVSTLLLILGFGLLLGPLGQLLGYVISFAVAPLTFIYIVLIYYDLRVRKENYDTDALEADLRH